MAFSSTWKVTATEALRLDMHSPPGPAELIFHNLATRVHGQPRLGKTALSKASIWSRAAHQLDKLSAVEGGPTNIHAC